MKASLFFIAIILSISCASQHNEYLNYNQSLPELLKAKKISLESIEIHIKKSNYKLAIFAEDEIIKEYPVVFGGNPIDDKRMQGDECTPEGEFRMISKYPHQSWSKFIWINYPNEESWKKHHKAKQDGTIPSSAKIGGEIGIHGVPDHMDKMIDLRYNWTLGCISLKNKDIEEIYPYINEQTPIIISK